MSMALVNDVLALFRDGAFYAKLAIGLVVWYVLAIGLSHLLFDRTGREPVEATAQGAMLAMFLMAVAAGLLSFYVWGSLALAIGLGLLLIVMPLVLTVGLRQLGSR